MSKNTIIQDSAPLQNRYLPPEFVDRKKQKERLQSVFSDPGNRNLHIYGSRGTGKTHLTLSLLQEIQDSTNTAHIPCTECRTQYKTLQQIYQSIADESISKGHHTAELKRKIDKKTQAIKTIVVLDEIDFLLQNDGDDLLYYLSRTTGITSVVISNNQKFNKNVEERTLSSLQPQKLRFEPLSQEQHYQLLYKRAQDSLKPQSLHQAALNYIVSQTSNIAFSLHWLRTAAQSTESLISTSTVQESREQAYQNYAADLLGEFTQHHQLLYTTILQLFQQNKGVIRSGEVYQKYQEICDTRSTESLSNRRISTYLKHLELLRLIQSEYHYGGKTGKTRKIKLQKPNQD